MRRSRLFAALIDPYGVEMHGIARGSVALLPEPCETWLKVLSAAMPFRDSLACVANGGQGEHFSSRARRYFRTVRDMSLPVDKINEANTGVPSVIGSTTGGLDEGTMDAVCFTGSAFSTVMYDLPHVITDVHRVLRPHGVLGVIAHDRGRIVGPRELAEDFDSMVLEIQKRADERDVAAENGFRDVPLPYSNIQRAWYETEYPVSVANLAAFVRSWPAYQRYVCPEHETYRPGCLRRQVDPLEALCLSFDAFTHAKRTSLQAVARLQVNFCVLTCDNRGVNRDRLHPGAISPNATLPR